MSRMKRLSRQITKSFGTDEFEQKLQELAPALATLPDSEGKEFFTQTANEMSSFLDMVEETYNQLDEKANFAQRNLEVSSQELMQANKNLFELNQTFDAMVNSLGQGFFLFNSEGKCLNVYSKACETLLECSPAGKDFVDVVKVPEKEHQDIKDWYSLLFTGNFDFADLSNFGPKVYPHSQGLKINLEYKPVYNKEGVLELIVLIATDRTAEYKAKEQARKMLAFATLVTAILKDKQRFRKFISATKELFNQIRVIVNGPEFNEKLSNDVKRHLHTLKGAVGSFGMEEVKDYIHELETRLANHYDLTMMLEELHKSVPELEQIFEDTLNEHREIFDEALAYTEPTREVAVSVLHKLNQMLIGLGPVVATVHTHFVQNVLSVPLRRIFAQYDTVLQDTAAKLGKRVHPIDFIGEDLVIVPEKFESLLASFVHIFRNIMDHGIEPSEVRQEKGKGPKGRVVISFSSVGSGTDLMIKIRDDGKGIDVKAIKERLLAKGLPVKGTDQEIMNRIFDPSFTTVEKVTEFSGRGVGLDAVKAEIEKLGGTITVDSEIGKWTAFTIVIPNVLEQEWFVLSDNKRAA
jgi:two-component system chemotaxis sensor kinase CheA